MITTYCNNCGKPTGQADTDIHTCTPTNVRKVETLKIGEYVKRKPDANKVYKRGAYDAYSKRYALEDTEEMNREIWVKRGTVLFVGFTY